MRYKKYLIFKPGPVDRVYYFWETLLMKKYLLVLFTIILSVGAMAQAISGSAKTFACAGQETTIQTLSGPGPGYFWQVSTDKGSPGLPSRTALRIAVARTTS
jgi:hypothetical protein